MAAVGTSQPAISPKLNIASLLTPNKTGQAAQLFRETNAFRHGSNSALDDRELVDRCRSGSDEAFRELVDTYKGMVFAVVLRSLPDRADVEDVAQEVFVRVHRGLRNFRGDARLSTWICRIAMNAC